jgi:FSR family fosmidomycin resistance protein-like MFS transporter
VSIKSELRGDATVIGLVALAHGMSHFYHLLLAPLFPAIKEEFGVSYAALGLVVALFFVSSAFLQPLAGFVVDRFGGRKVLTSGMALLAFGTVIMALAPSYAVLAAGAVIAGIGNSVFHPADYSILNARVQESRLGHAFSAHSIGGALGFAASPLISGTVGALYGWRVAVLVGAAAGFAMLAMLLINRQRLDGAQAAAARSKAPAALDGRILLAAPVLLCFVFFVVYAAGIAGIQSFTVSALTLQYAVGATFAAVVLTSYMLGSAFGMFIGGFLVARTPHHDRVAACGLGGSALVMALVGLGAWPSGALPAAFAVAGALAGFTFPARDLLVRASAPAGATGRVYGFVYSGLDVGVFATPVFYGWMMDRSLPQGVFYAIAAFTAVSILAILGLPGKAPAPAIQRT